MYIFSHVSMQKIHVLAILKVGASIQHPFLLVVTPDHDYHSKRPFKKFGKWRLICLHR
jgi:hypothetical protein